MRVRFTRVCLICVLSLPLTCGAREAAEGPGEETGAEVGIVDAAATNTEDVVQEASLEIDAEATGLKEAPPAPAEDEDVARSWDIRWEHGIHFELTQKVLFPGYEYFPWRHRDYRKLVGRMGAKLHVDAAAVDESGDIPPIQNDAELRRGRLYALGDTYFFRPLDFKVEFGFSGSDFFFTEGYMRWNDVSWLSTIQVGQFKTPMSLEMMGSSGMSVFMERGSPVLAFAPASRLGLQIGGPFMDERVTLTAGAFANVADLNIGDATESAAGPIGRFTVAPILRDGEGGNEVLHLGLSASYTASRKDAFQYRSTPECFVAPFVVDTGEMKAEYSAIYGLEAAFIRGPWTLQAEHLHSYVNRNDGDNVRFMGSYAYLSWFITGESRPYNSNKGLLSRVEPRERFSLREKKWGAWETSVRASYLDLSDEDVHGGRMMNLSGGLNWYFSRDERLMFNYVYSDVDDTDEAGRLHIVQLRIQFEY